MFKKLISTLSSLGNKFLKKVNESREVKNTSRDNLPFLESNSNLSNDEVQERIKNRIVQGKPVGQLINEANKRGISISTAGMSNSELKSAIKGREVQGHTGRTDSVTHSLNCAQTNRLSGGEISSLIQSRRDAGLPTGKLEAAARDRNIPY